MSDGLGSSAGVLAGLGVAGAVAVCCGAKLLLAGGIAAGVAAGWLDYWPLSALAGVLVAAGLWRRRRRRVACATETSSRETPQATPSGSQGPS